MLFERLIDLMFEITYMLLGLLDTVNVDLFYNALSTVFDILDIAGFFLPLETIFIVLGILISEELFKITLSLLKMIWKFIPLFGA